MNDNESIADMLRGLFRPWAPGEAFYSEGKFQGALWKTSPGEYTLMVTANGNDLVAGCEELQRNGAIMMRKVADDKYQIFYLSEKERLRQPAQ